LRLSLAPLLLLFAGVAPAADIAGTEMWRLDCGRIVVRDLNAFSDTYAYVGRQRTLVASCYLIRHGTDWVLWDAGLPERPVNDPADVEQAEQTTTIAAQLARLGVRPDQISILGISHYHYDHTGQAARFPQARLLIGARDADAIRESAARAQPLAPWFGGSAKLDPVDGDRDVFGDGRVVVLDLPGHTPGHHGLLVRLAHKGPVLLSGDVAHFRENYAGGGVPPFNTNRADSLASLDRFRKLAANLRATVILQHDPDDVAKLAAFPASTD
jgi:N-acyl homoserine lactone hydrolase